MKRIPLKILTILMIMLIFCASAQAKEVPYTAKLEASEGIYQGHGADYGFARRVGADGVYTIVEEAFDEYGNLWGRLKSGAGWVMLEAAKQTPENQMTAQEILYTVSLKADEPIYEDIGGFSGPDGFVGEDGVYSIIEEMYFDGILWGQLKSGAGWVQLTDVPSAGAPLLHADYYQVPLGAWVPIYTAAGYERGICSAIVGEDGVYTIVAEVEDEWGNVWGRLKSGAGWIDLDYVRWMGNPPMTAYFADILELEEGCYEEFGAEDSEYSVKIAFRANEQMRYISLNALTWEEEGYTTDERLHWISRLEEDTYFVAEVVFYGDMTTFGLTFMDSSDEWRNYSISLSGMDGSLVVNEYIQ